MAVDRSVSVLLTLWHEQPKVGGMEERPLWNERPFARSSSNYERKDTCKNWNAGVFYQGGRANCCGAAARKVVQ